MGVRTRVRVFGDFLTQLLVNVFRHDIASLAAQISFYAIFSLFPLLILMIFGASLAVPHQPVVELLVEALKPYYPDVSNANHFLQDNIEKLGTVGARAGFVSLITLAWSATSAFIAVQQALDSIFEVTAQRSFLARRIVAAIMLCLLIALAVICSIALAIFPMVHLHVPASSFLAAWVSRLRGITRILYPLSLFVTSFVVYRYLPSRRVDVNCVILGALASTILLDLARTLFVVYASHLVTYHFIYGSLTVVILLVLWMYIALIILLFGAEVAALVEKMGNEREGADENE
ncbi:ribonuclease BN [Alicyclobacillus tengchongensis]|nr:ribonuclease BN [Alicyclobacillus tengchongensis]